MASYVSYFTPFLSGMSQKEFKKNEKCIFFGRMFRYRNNTMMPSTSQRMMADLSNTLSESTVTKVIRRGKPLQLLILLTLYSRYIVIGKPKWIKY